MLNEPGFGGEAGAALAAVLSFQGTDPDPREEALCCQGTSGCIPMACRCAHGGTAPWQPSFIQARGAGAGLRFWLDEPTLFPLDH